MTTANETPATGRRRTGIAVSVISAFSNQLGAAGGSLAFPVIGPAGVVAVRQIVAAAILLPLVRPSVRALTRSQWWPVLFLAVVFGTMNLSLYSAIDRIGLGLAVTLEFLGPLAVALLSSRSRANMICALGAGAGVVAICRPQPSPTTSASRRDYSPPAAGPRTSSSTGPSAPASPGYRAPQPQPASPPSSSYPS